MQCKDALAVLFLYLRPTNPFKPADVIFLSRAHGAFRVKFTNCAMGAEKKRGAFLIRQMSYLPSDNVYFAN
jgi:hypothetical protein